MTFVYDGAELDYFDHAYNTTRLNERAVEIPIATRFIGDDAGAGLELGNVLGHYLPRAWRCVDRHEQMPGVENLDVFDITGQFDWIVAISTIEHVRWDEDPREIEPTGGLRALDHLVELLAPGGRMLVTVPFGWNPYLDTELLTGAVTPSRQCSMVRDGAGWRETAAEHRPYAATTRWAESVWVAEWR